MRIIFLKDDYHHIRVAWIQLLLINRKNGYSVQSIFPMVSPTSTTNKYILQPSLLKNHRLTLEWISSALLWKRELAFFQKLLEHYAPKFSSVEDKKKVDHFQHFITYYNGELVDVLHAKLNLHEKNLAETLEKKDELNTKYFNEHEELMNSLEATNTQMLQGKEDFFAFIGRVM